MYLGDLDGCTHHHRNGFVHGQQPPGLVEETPADEPRHAETELLLGEVLVWESQHAVKSLHKSKSAV